MKLVQNASDEAGFVRVVEHLITSAADAHRPASFYVVKLDNWFGPKWLGFNHKLLGAAGVFVRDGGAPRLVPPFNPSRVVTTCRYVRVSTIEHEPLPGKLHIYQTSEDNRRRHLDRVMPDDGAFWWSSASRENGRGSLMAYLPGHEGHVGWYVSFKRTIEIASGGEVIAWTPAQLRGTTRRELQGYLKLVDDPVKMD